MPQLKADRNKLAYIGAKPGENKSSVRDSDSWYTPSMYTDMAREVMGGIDLDPFSSKTANRHIKASRFFDVESNAFDQIWFKEQGTVFMNPPYGRKMIDASVDIFLANVKSKSIAQAVVLVNNATETKWFQSLLRYAPILCMPGRRIAFETEDGKHVSGNTRGQVFFYFGQRVQRFKKVFGQIGAILIANT